MLENINLAILLPIILIQLVLMVIALVDLAKSEKANGPKWVWVLIILFGNLLGSVLYFVIGRRNS